MFEVWMTTRQMCRVQSKDKDGAMHRVQNDAAYTSVQSNQKAVSHALTGGWWGIGICWAFGLAYGRVWFYARHGPVLDIIMGDTPQPESPRLLHASRHNGCGWIAWFVAICRYFAMKQCGTVAISKTCLLLPEVFRKRSWCNVIRLLTALGIDGFCCRKRAFGYLATYSVTCFMNFLLFSWYHAFFPGQLRMLKQPNWNLLALSFCSLCPAEDVDIPVAASMSSLSGTAGKIQVLISLTWSVDLGRRAGCCPHAELDHHNLFQIEYWTIFRCWSSIRFH